MSKNKANKLINSIFNPQKIKLNPRNKNHWISLLRGVAKENGWNDNDIKSILNYKNQSKYYIEKYSPIDAFIDIQKKGK